MAERWVDRFWPSAEGLRLHARDYAAAEGTARLPVICIHGLTRNARDFEAIAPRMADWQRRVLTIDVRGRGDSDRDPDGNYRLLAYVDDVIRMAEALGIARAILVGTSMGGLITLELASRAPSLVAAAVINDVGPELAPAGLARIGGYVGKAPRFDDWDAAAAHLRAQNGAALPHYGTADWLAMARRMCRLDGGTIVPDYDPDIAKVFGEEPLQVDPWLRWDALAERPILLLRGADSDLLDADVAARMVAGRPDATLVEIPAVGHAPMLDESEALTAIAAFLGRLA